MKFSLEATDSNQIFSYDDNQIIISPEKQRYPLQLGTSLIVTPDQIINDTKIGDITNLSDENITFLQNLKPEIIILTAGSTAHRPLSNTAIKLAKKSIGAESMTLGAASRTYNLLVLEGRRVILVISLI
ncbi:MAG: MTH938/NDUFAF3 family protein [Methylophagaceae bacterium]